MNNVLKFKERKGLIALNSFHTILFHILEPLLLLNMRKLTLIEGSKKVETFVELMASGCKACLGVCFGLDKGGRQISCLNWVQGKNTTSCFAS